MQLIETKTLTTSAATIDFTSIPQNFTDLLILASVRSNEAAVGEYICGTFNANTTGYSARELQGNGSTAASGSYTTGLASRLMAYAVGNGATANTFANSSIYIPNYSGSANKSRSGDGVSENNATLSVQSIIAGLWANTAAITSVSLLPFSGTAWLTGSTISLYGISKGSGGATVS
jgi:hypothetical protein